MSWRSLDTSPSPLGPVVPFNVPSFEGYAARPTSAMSQSSNVSFSSPASRSSAGLDTAMHRFPGLLSRSSVVASPVDSPTGKSISSFLIPRRKPIPASRHSMFYMQDEMSVFLVDGVLFRVHRYFLQRESDVFRTMFVCPPTKEGPEGRTDDRPILLPEVTCTEFATLLKFFYNSMYKQPLESVDEWVDLLSISTRYGMENVRERALEELDSLPPLDPIRRIVLAKKHDVLEWLIPAYAALCRRVEPLTVSEAIEIGLETTVFLATAREKVRERDIINIIAGNASGEEPDDPFVLGVIDEVFGLRATDT